MESLESPTMHPAETDPICSTLPCVPTTNEEISPKLEEQLLYGSIENGDEEDAQSDDSLRLHLSEDEMDTDENNASLPVNNETNQSDKTESLDMEFDVNTSNDCPMQHGYYSNGIYQIRNENKDSEKQLNLRDEHFLKEKNFPTLAEENEFKNGTSQSMLNIGSNKTCFHEASRLNRVHQASSDHSYHSTVSNYYCNKYYNQNSHYGRPRGHKFGGFNTIFDSLELEQKYCPKVYSSSRKLLSKTNPITTGSNSQKNFSATNIASNKDESSTGLENDQEEVHNDIKPISTDNNNSQLDASELPITKLNTLQEADDEFSLPDVIEPKKEIDDEINEITITTSEAIPLPNSESELLSEQPVNKLDSEEFNVSSKEQDNIDNSENSIPTIECQQSIEDTSVNEDIIMQTTASEIVQPTPLNDPIEQNVVNEEEVVITETSINIDDKSDAKNETITQDENVEENVEEKLNNDTTNDEKQTNDNSESTIISECKPIHEEEYKIGSKRPLNVSDSENSVCKKIPCGNEEASNLVDITKIETPEIIKEPSTVEDSMKLELCVENGNKTQNPTELKKKSPTINLKSERLKSKTIVLPIEVIEDEDNADKDDDKLEITAVIQSGETTAKSCKRRRQKRKINSSSDSINSGQGKENVRHKRETAQKAEEMIRKRFLNNDSDSESSDNVSARVNNSKSNSRARPPSPSALKRNYSNELSEETVKKAKKDSEDKTFQLAESEIKKNCHKNLEQVRKFFWRDGKKSLSKFTQGELEELLIQKIIETITMRDEIGKLREQAKISERNQEATRLKCQQLSKQIKDFEMVLSRFSADRRTGDKNVPPIKINRSVGLQVNFLGDGVQNLRQLQSNSKPNGTVANGGNTPSKQSAEIPNVSTNGRKGLKVRSPRRPNDVPSTLPPVSVASTQNNSPTVTPVTSAAIFVPKSTENHLINSTSQVVSAPIAVTVVNGVVTTTPRPSKVLNTRSSNNNDNLIDLTGEEDKSKNIPNIPPLTAITTISNASTVSKAPPRYQRVIQPTPPSITIAQPAIKLVQPVEKPMPTTIVNSMNTPRLAFVMHGISGQRQYLIPSNPPIRPAVTTNNRAPFPITYTGVPTVSNGSVRVVPVTTTASSQKYKHPAPLPGVTNYPVNRNLKLPPPAPALKISKVANGIVLSWNMKISSEYAEIASYQLFAYQEITGTPPNTTLWKKVGDVRALPLPMACTLTQFSEGNNYYFAVRAVDTHSRFGQYSQPGNISL